MHSADFSKCIFYVFLVVISVSERQFFPARSEPCERCRIDIIDVLQFVTNKIEGVFANQILIIIFHQDLDDLEVALPSWASDEFQVGIVRLAKLSFKVLNIPHAFKFMCMCAKSKAVD